jgi:hypothetical protein
MNRAYRLHASLALPLAFVVCAAGGSAGYQGPAKSANARATPATPTPPAGGKAPGPEASPQKADLTGGDAPAEIILRDGTAGRFWRLIVTGKPSAWSISWEKSST